MFHPRAKTGVSALLVIVGVSLGLAQAPAQLSHPQGY